MQIWYPLLVSLGLASSPIGSRSRASRARLVTALALLVLSSVACSSGTAEGTVLVTAYGEPFIEEGIPAAEMSDGWKITFDRFLVSIQNVQVDDQRLDGLDPVNLTEHSKGLGQELGALLVPEGSHDHASFVVESMIIEGHAEKDGSTKSFGFVFDEPVTYDRCETTTRVREGDTSTFQITVHGDHLFYDSLVSSNPKLLFGPLALADKNDDGEITQAELETTDIGAYDPGSEDGIDDMWTWLKALAKTVGHVDGEAHCHALED